jgi:hypothetical protein
MGAFQILADHIFPVDGRRQPVGALTGGCSHPPA